MTHDNRTTSEDRERALDEHAAALALAREIAGPDGIIGVILDDDRMIITVPPRDQHETRRQHALRGQRATSQH